MIVKKTNVQISLLSSEMIVSRTS